MKQSAHGSNVSTRLLKSFQKFALYVFKGMGEKK